MQIKVLQYGQPRRIPVDMLAYGDSQSLRILKQPRNPIHIAPNDPSPSHNSNGGGNSQALRDVCHLVKPFYPYRSRRRKRQNSREHTFARH